MWHLSNHGPHQGRLIAIRFSYTNAMKWIYPLLARSVDRVPGVETGEPFHTIRNRGNGLNSYERANLLDVVLTVCLDLYISTSFR